MTNDDELGSCAFFPDLTLKRVAGVEMTDDDDEFAPFVVLHHFKLDDVLGVEMTDDDELLSLLTKVSAGELSPADAYHHVGQIKDKKPRTRGRPFDNKLRKQLLKEYLGQMGWIARYADNDFKDYLANKYHLSRKSIEAYLSSINKSLDEKIGRNDEYRKMRKLFLPPVTDDFISDAGRSGSEFLLCCWLMSEIEMPAAHDMPEIVLKVLSMSDDEINKKLKHFYPQHRRKEKGFTLPFRGMGSAQIHAQVNKELAKQRLLKK